MKCPNCGYTAGLSWDEEKEQYVYVTDIDEFGDFYKLPISVKKKELYVNDVEGAVYACPSCRILFMSEE